MHWTSQRREGDTMQVTATTASSVPTCPPPSAEPARHSRIFPPRDADADTYRRWIAASPWPEVVFASAGAR